MVGELIHRHSCWDDRGHYRPEMHITVHTHAHTQERREEVKWGYVPLYTVVYSKEGCLASCCVVYTYTIQRDMYTCWCTREKLDAR